MLACYIFILTPLAKWYDHRKYSITIGSYFSFVALNKLNSIVHNQYLNANPIENVIRIIHHVNIQIQTFSIYVPYRWPFGISFVVKILVNKTTNHVIFLA